MSMIQHGFKKTPSVWFVGLSFSLIFFVLPCMMVTPIKTAEGKWKFIERTGEGGLIVDVLFMFVLASLIYFIVDVIRTKCAFERVRHQELTSYEVFYTFGWLLLAMSVGMVAMGWSNKEYFPSELILLGIPLFLFRKNLSVIGLRRHPISWRIVGGVGLCYAAFGLADWGTKWMMGVFSIDIYSAREETIATTLQGYFGTGQWGLLIGQIAAISLIGPFWEEVLFRGVIQTYFMQNMRTFWAVVLSAGLFAVAHGDPSLVLSLFISGILFGWLYSYTKSVWPSIALHVLNNSVATILTLFFPSL